MDLGQKIHLYVPVEGPPGLLHVITLHVPPRSFRSPFPEEQEEDYAVSVQVIDEWTCERLVRYNGHLALQRYLEGSVLSVPVTMDELPTQVRPPQAQGVLTTFTLESLWDLITLLRRHWAPFPPTEVPDDVLRISVLLNCASDLLVPAECLQGITKLQFRPPAVLPHQIVRSADSLSLLPSFDTNKGRFVQGTVRTQDPGQCELIIVTYEGAPPEDGETFGMAHFHGGNGDVVRYTPTAFGPDHEVGLVVASSRRVSLNGTNLRAQYTRRVNERETLDEEQANVLYRTVMERLIQLIPVSVETPVNSMAPPNWDSCDLLSVFLDQVRAELNR